MPHLIKVRNGVAQQVKCPGCMGTGMIPAAAAEKIISDMEKLIAADLADIRRKQDEVMAAWTARGVCAATR